MSRSKPARVVTTDAEIDAAIALAKVREPFRPKAVAVSYHPKSDVVAIKLATGVELAIPRMLLQGLESAMPAQLAAVEIVGAQDGLHWGALDVDHYIPALVEGVFGNRRWMSAIGKIGGQARSAVKARAVRQNGRKGGRPRKAAARSLN